MRHGQKARGTLGQLLRTSELVFDPNSSQLVPPVAQRYLKSMPLPPVRSAAPAQGCSMTGTIKAQSQVGGKFEAEQGAALGRGFRMGGQRPNVTGSRDRLIGWWMEWRASALRNCWGFFLSSKRPDGGQRFARAAAGRLHAEAILASGRSAGIRRSLEESTGGSDHYRREIFDGHCVRHASSTLKFPSRRAFGCCLSRVGR